jgi:biotin carboxyl carrier protein
MATKTFVATVGSAEREIQVTPRDDGKWDVVIDGVTRVVEARRVEGTNTWALFSDGGVVTVDVDPGKQGDVLVEVRGTQMSVKLVDPRTRKLEQAKAAAKAARAANAGPEALAAPMPGKVVKVLVKVGDKVTAGQGVVVIEAMKMENELRAPRDATVLQVHVAEGNAVEGQQPVLTLG